MAFGINLGFGSSKSKTKSSSKSTTTGTNKLFSMSEAQRAQLDELIGAFMGRVNADEEDPRYSKEAAIADSQNIVAAVFDRFSKTALPQIFAGQNKAGAYNSTSAQLMANDAFAQANTQAAGLVLENIINYAQLQGTDKALELQGLLGAFGLAADATKVEEINQTTKSRGTSRTSGTEIGLSGSFGSGGKLG